MHINIYLESDIFFQYSSLKEKRRRIYYKVKYEEKEEEAIEEVKRELLARNLTEK